MTDLEKKLSEYVKKHYQAREITGDAVAILNNEADRFIEILNNHIGQLPFSFSITKGQPEVQNGEYYIGVHFDHDGAHRDSWYDEKYPDKVDLIILFNNGYSADDYVYNKETHARSLRFRDGLQFVQAAVDDFNNSADGGVYAEYNDIIYKSVL